MVENPCFNATTVVANVTRCQKVTLWGPGVVHDSCGGNYVYVQISSPVEGYEVLYVRMNSEDDVSEEGCDGEWGVWWVGGL